MGRKKAQKKAVTPSGDKKSLIRKALKEAKARLPSERSKIRCEGCFSPRGTLTVAPHVEKTWFKQQIVVEDGFVLVPCHFCTEIRKLSMSKFSFDVFLADYDQYVQFVLLKDDKFNAFIGIESPLTLEEIA